ncbi:hypothetical protein [uncultured Clostridium sp.]|uniref:hypothetical protein n=1 Tax=uncultured Clostridium sp. TaxID=59620 RepID=UPI0025FC9987|nr:hypothetical protein [uncultured Clostridium sp.]
MNNINIFPSEVNWGKYKPEAQNLQIQTYGRRIRKDQTFYEYLIEFLLVFIGEGHNTKEVGLDKIKDYDKRVHYEYENNIGLKRFIFLENSKKDNRYDIDEDANRELKEQLLKKMEVDGVKSDELLEIIRELYLGFTAFSGDRGWFAKALLPMCKDTIFPEAMGKVKFRKNLELWKNGMINLEVDEEFEFNEHNFMARGGEVYFLHVLQGLKYIGESDNIEAENLKNEINVRIGNLIDSFPQFRELSEWISSTWKEYIYKESNGDKLEKIKSDCMWISNNYKKRSKFTIKELVNILRADINEFDKYEILSLAIIIQILRMMSEAAVIVATEEKEDHPLWVVHVNGSSNNKVKKLAIESYKDIEENMMIAVAKMLVNYEKIKENRSGKKPPTKSSLLKDAYDDSHKLLRKLGKDIGFVIPIKGDNMRFTVTDNIVKFFVLSLIEPEKKVTLDTFLQKLYINFGIIIGPREYEEYLKDKEIVEDYSFLQNNLDDFQVLLRKNGFLKELSDATSIVINPYRKLEV